MTNYQIIKQVDFLASLDEAAIKKISDRFQEIHLPKGAVLFKENEYGDCFYILKTGRISLTKKINLEEEATGELFFFGANEYFGELALIDDEPRSGTATVIDDANLLKISKEDFLNVCQDYPTVLFTIVKTMSKRLRETNERYIKMWDSLIKQKKLAAIGSAASKIVHDIRTPITIIILTAEVIARFFENSSLYTDKIIKQVHVLDNMVKEILEFARGRKSELNIKKIVLDEFFDEMLEQMNPLAESNNVKLLMINNVRNHVFFDPIKIHQTIFNIFKNGIEAIGEADGKVEIKAEVENDKLHISIYNDGPPIPQHFLDQLFEPFATYGKKTGTGLGLAICQKTIKDHDGEMTVKNLPAGGVQFDIYLPVNQ